MSAFAGEHNSEPVPQKNSHHRRNHVLSHGTAKKMMISGSGFNEKCSCDRMIWRKMLCTAASEGCELAQEEARSHQPIQGAVGCAIFIQHVLHEELKDQWQSDAAAQKKLKQPDDEAQESRAEVRVEQMELPDACVEIDAMRATTVSWTSRLSVRDQWQSRKLRTGIRVAGRSETGQSRRLEAQALKQDAAFKREGRNRQAVLTTAAEPEVIDLG